MQIVLSLDIGGNSEDPIFIIADAEKDFEMNLINTDFTIWLKQEAEMLKILDNGHGSDFDYFADYIEECIDKKNNITERFGGQVDLGFLYNQHSQAMRLAEKTGQPLDDLIDWDGDDLLFWGYGSHRFKSNASFLYNDENGKIIIEFSSMYPWRLTDAPSKELDISYEDWLPESKVLYKKEISKATAKQWVKQLRKLHHDLEENMPYRKEEREQEAKQKEDEENKHIH